MVLSGQRALIKSYPRRVRSRTRSCMASIGDLPLQLFTILAYTLRSHQKQAQSIVIPKIFQRAHVKSRKNLPQWYLVLGSLAQSQSNASAEGCGYGPEIVGYVTTPLIKPPLQEILDPPLTLIKVIVHSLGVV